MTGTLLALALCGQLFGRQTCQPGMPCYQGGGYSTYPQFFYAQPAPAYQYLAPAAQPRVTTSPTAAAALAPSAAAVVGPSMSDVLAELHKLRQAVDDTKSLTPFAGSSRAKMWLEGYCDRCCTNHEKCEKTPGGPGCQCVTCQCEPSPKREESVEHKPVEPKAESATGEEKKPAPVLAPNAAAPDLPKPSKEEPPPVERVIGATEATIFGDAGAPMTCKDAEGNKQCISYGVLHEKMVPEGKEKYDWHGPDAAAVVGALQDPDHQVVGAPELKDDSDWPWLVLCGTAEERELVKHDLQDEELAPLAGKLRIFEYEPSFWYAKQAGITGHPGIAIVTPQGTELLRESNYRRGGRLRLLAKLHKARGHEVPVLAWWWIQEHFGIDHFPDHAVLYVGIVAVLLILLMQRKGGAA